ELLATDLDDARTFRDGAFVTLYLAPQHYHRVHAPLAGRLTAARYVPGDLFSVNASTVPGIPKLFARNERLVCHFATDSGPLIVVLVGALNVGSIGTPWSGEIRPRRRGVVEELDLARRGVDPGVAKGGLLGWFNMGSTVIVLLPPGACDLDGDLQRATQVVMGRPIATLRNLSP
ncbi:MAG TPA: archaetidylserine decarboxylase, partial [Woeseiaceae bacterium]|nr:archaetidylserine decarboxylase [Woeseiaceae bacterium]